jgi:hypothetical protein
MTIIHGKMWKKMTSFMGRCGKNDNHSLEDVEKMTIIHWKMWKKMTIQPGKFSQIWAIT